MERIYRAERNPIYYNYRFNHASMKKRVQLYMKGEHDCILYVLSADNKYYKIGITYNLKSRLKKHQTSNHKELTVVGVFDDEYLGKDIPYAYAFTQWSESASNIKGLETFLKNWLTKYHVRGEWYKWDSEEHRLSFVEFLASFIEAYRSSCTAHYHHRKQSLEWEVFREIWLH